MVLRATTPDYSKLCKPPQRRTQKLQSNCRARSRILASARRIVATGSYGSTGHAIRGVKYPGTTLFKYSSGVAILLSGYSRVTARLPPEGRHGSSKTWEPLALRLHSPSTGQTARRPSRFCGSSEEANAAPDIRFHSTRALAFERTSARGRCRTCRSHSDGIAPVAGGVLCAALREAARVHAHPDGPARAVPRGGFGRRQRNRLYFTMQ